MNIQCCLDLFEGLLVLPLLGINARQEHLGIHIVGMSLENFGILTVQPLWPIPTQA